MIPMEIYKIRGTSSVSVDKIYSIVALRVRVFFSLSNNVLPCNRVCDKKDLINSSNLQSILFKVLRRVYRPSLNVGQWRRKYEVDSISKPQLYYSITCFLIVKRISWRQNDDFAIFVYLFNLFF